MFPQGIVWVAENQKKKSLPTCLPKIHFKKWQQIDLKNPNMYRELTF